MGIINTDIGGLIPRHSEQYSSARQKQRLMKQRTIQEFLAEQYNKQTLVDCRNEEVVDE